MTIPLADIEAAAAVIAPVAVITPVLTSTALDERVGATVLAKAEAHQRAGAFKFRGAYTRLDALTAEERAAGVVAVSSGNHGAAVAAAAAELGIEATVFVPEDVPEAKRRLIESAGARVEFFDRGRPDRERPALDHAAATGATFVHPYEDPLVMTGQGTVGLELHRQVGELDAVFVPMSGGGLMAGVASALHELDPDCDLVGVEPERADDTARSFAAGDRVQIEPPQTIADGLAVRTPGERTFAINRRLLRAVRTVSEDEIIAAMVVAAEDLGVRLEPSGAASLAGVLAGGDLVAGRRVGVVLSGGNIDDDRFRALCGAGTAPPP